MNAQPYTTVIGLEVHVQLATRTKLFCGCRTDYGAPPNTQTCPVCLGLPGALPVLNDAALELGSLTALALHCHIPAITKWDRKQYYYPDLPKGYQISQYDEPIAQRGYLEIRDPAHDFRPKRIGIVRAHLEEDAGKSMHDEVAGKHDSRIDLNRTGTPLLEIVSEPDLRSPEEAKAFLTELKLLLQYLEVSDCNMQEGSLRVDANVNLHIAADHPGATTMENVVATPIVEIKNMNSFRAVERALAYESERQYLLWRETGQRQGEIPKQTRGWDDQKEVTLPQRSKEESSDYRYFPDPDLVPIRMATEHLERLRNRLPELPAALRARLSDTWGLGPGDAELLVQQGRGLVTYYDQVARQCGDGRAAFNWVQRDVLRYLKEQGTSIAEFPVPAGELAALLVDVRDARVESSRARDVFSRMLEHRESLPQAVAALGITPVDRADVEALCRELLAANPKVVDDVRKGNDKALGALLGQAKKRNPNVSPGLVREICQQLIMQLP